MIEWPAFFAFVAAGVAIVIVPGPTVTVIVANSLRHGARAGLINVAGTQLGLASMLAVVALGLHVVVAQMAGVFEVVRIAGAVYLVWLGVKLVRGGKFQISEAAAKVDTPAASSDRAFFWQGFWVLWANPKALLLFGALIPQFVSVNAEPLVQTILLGLTFMLTAAVFDSVYAFAAGGAGRWLTRARVRMVEGLSGAILIAGGLWLALGRR